MADEVLTCGYYLVERSIVDERCRDRMHDVYKSGFVKKEWALHWRLKGAPHQADGHSVAHGDLGQQWGWAHWCHGRFNSPAEAWEWAKKIADLCGHDLIELPEDDREEWLNEEPRDAYWLKWEVPEGCLDLDDYLQGKKDGVVA